MIHRLVLSMDIGGHVELQSEKDVLVFEVAFEAFHRGLH